jgi:hypothetical protein
LAHFSNTTSCFKDYIIPTASYKFYSTEKGIVQRCFEKTVTLDYYIDQIDQDIRASITKIYQDNATVTLCYSGGIDSMVILSYILSLGFLSRTNIVCFENVTQVDNTCLHLDAVKKEKVLAVLDLIGPNCNDITWLKFDQEDFVYNITNLDFRHAQCYTTSALLRRYNDTAFLFGYHGNQVLLHKKIFIDEIVKYRPGAKEEFLQLPKNYYAQNLIDHTPPTDIPGIEKIHMMIRPWAALDGYQGNRIYSPIGSNLTFNLLRRLDFSKISVNIVADAQIARELIARNTGKQLSEYITTESLGDLDSFRFPGDSIPLVDKIEKLLIIPDLNHNPQGLEYLTTAIKQSISNKNIEVNVLMSVKALQWLSNQ